MTHAVVVNDRGQYSVWPAGTELAAGWRCTGWKGSEQECLDELAQRWDGSPDSPPEPSGSAAQLLRSERIVLREVLPDEAAQLRQGLTAGVRWADGAPFEGTRVAAGMLADAAGAGLHAPGWGLYLIIRTEDATAVGGIGFHGPPDEGVAEVGFDLCASARGQGYAAEALRRLAAEALRRPGVSAVIARTEPENIP